MMMMMGGPAAPRPPPARAGVAARADARRLLQLRAELRQHRRRLRDPGDHLPRPTSGARRRSTAPQRHASISEHGARNFTRASPSMAASAPPLTIRTGTDDNGDLVFNDRPAGVGRNSARTTALRGTRRRTSATRSRSARRQVTSGGGVQIMGSPAGLTVICSSSHFFSGAK